MSAEEMPKSDATRAYEFALAEAWELARGMKDAYQVDTGADLDWTISPWSDLRPEQKLAWSVQVGPTIGGLVVIADRIAGSKS